MPDLSLQSPTDQPTLPWLGVRRDGVRWRAWLLAASEAKWPPTATGASFVSYETQPGRLPLRLSFQIKVF